MPQVGDAWIEVHADGSGLFREIREIADRAAAGAKITLKIDLDKKGLTEKVKAAAAAASRAAKIEFTGTLDSRKVKAEARALRTAGGKISFDADVDTAGVSAKIAALRQRIQSNAINIPVRLNPATLRNSATIAGQNVAKGISSGATDGLRITNSKFGATGVVLKFLTAKVGLLVAAVVQALPYVEALGVAVAGLAVDLGSAALGIAGFAGSGLVAIGTGVAAVAVGVQGLGNAFKAVAKVQKLQAVEGKKTKAQQLAITRAIQAQDRALSGLAVSARDFVKASVRLQGPWKEFTRTVQQHLFEGLGDELRKTATQVLPVLAKGLGGIADVVNDTAISFLQWARSAKGIAALNSIFSQSKVVLEDLSKAAGNTAGGLLNLFTGGKKNAEGLGGALVKLTQGFQDWTTEITTPGKGGRSPLEDFFIAARVNIGKIRALLGSSGGLISAFFANWTGAGKNRPDILGDLQGQIERWAKALRDPANAGAIKDFIAQSKADFDSLKSAVLDVAGAINTLSDINLKGSALLDSVQNLGKQLADSLGAQGKGLVGAFAPQGSAAQVIAAWFREEPIPPVDVPVDFVPPKHGVLPSLLLGEQQVTVPWDFEPNPSNLTRPWAQTQGQAGGTTTGVPPINWSYATDPSKPPPWGSQPGRQTNVGGIAEVDWQYAQQAEGTPPWSNPNQGVPNAPNIDWTWAQSPTGAPPWSDPNQNNLNPTGPVLVDWNWKTLPTGDVGGPWSHPDQLPPNNGATPSIDWEWNDAPAGQPPWSQPGFTGAENAPPNVPWEWEHNPMGGPPWSQPGLVPTKPVADVPWTWKTNPDPNQPPWSSPSQLPPNTGAEPEIPWKWKTAAPGQPPWSNPNQGAPVEIGWVWATAPDGEPPWSHPTQTPPVIEFEPTVTDSGIEGLKNKLIRGLSGGGTSPNLPPITVQVVPNTTGFIGLNGTLVGMAGKVTVPVGYGNLPPFPTLPRPKVNIATGYNPLPRFPALPHPKVTVGTGYAPLPAFPALPSPVVHVRVVYDKVAAKGVVAQPLGGFTPDKKTAAGIHITNGPERRIIGEAGPEAVVPLRPSQTLDPAVARLLQAVAVSRGMGGGPEVVQNIMLPTGDPEAAAMAVANRLALVRTV